MIDMSLWVRLTLLGAALGAVPGLWLAQAIGARARRWWHVSYPAMMLRSRLRRTITRQTTAGARAPEEAPAVHQGSR